MLPPSIHPSTRRIVIRWHVVLVTRMVMPRTTARAVPITIAELARPEDTVLTFRCHALTPSGTRQSSETVVRISRLGDLP